MKLLIIPSWYPTKLHPASGSFFRDRAHILKNYGIDIIIAAPIIHSLKDIIPYNNTLRIEYFIDNGIPVYLNEIINIFPKTEKLQFYRYKKYAVLLLQKVINKHGMPDAIHFHSSLSAGAALFEECNQFKVPFFISEHLKEFLIPNGFTVFQKQLIQKTYESCSGIIATSDKLRNTISDLFPEYKSKISIIPNPVNEDIFVKKQILKNRSFTNIICIAMLRPEKHVELIIQSFYKLLQSGEKAKLTIVGDGPLKLQLINHIQKLNLSNSVELKGYLSQKHIVEELHKNDFLVLGSKVETFGTVLIEAQACGLPVIATDCGGPSDIISSDTGILVKPGSVNDLTRGMKNIIKKLDQYDLMKIRNRTIKYFGKKTYTEAIKRVVGKMII